MNFLRRTSLFVEFLTLIYNSNRDSAKNLLMFVMLIPYVFQIRCYCRTTRTLFITIIQEDLLKIYKNMLKLIQLFTSAWKNKNTERKGEKEKYVKL